MALTIRPSDLNDDQLQLAGLIGMDNFKKLVLTYGGMSLYIPKKDCFDRAARNEEIRKKFTGGNFRELAYEYDLTEVQIRSIVSDIVREVRARPLDGQVNLFEPENLESTLFAEFPK